MRRLWLTLPMADTEVRVYLASPDDHDLLTEDDPTPAEGMCLRGEGVVLISESVPARRRLGVLVHELLHAAVFLSGAATTARINDEREEALVSAVAPLLTHGLVEAGMLRGKRVPA